ncbi:MBOAT family protein [Candidatus Woesearchaeota archaeon]|nr:MBOAT family protein [Candidatus Woesearchaeota archaeon]
MIYLFHSFEFWIFFFLIFLIYWILPQKYRNATLLLGSYIFYSSWNLKLLSLILISTLTDYICGLKIYSEENNKKRRFYLTISIITNLSLLGFFKYFNFFIENFIFLLNSLGFQANISTLQIILPVGISFYTFQTLSYTIDIYRKKIKPTKNIIDFALFVTFFPQLIAGPIERAKRLIPILKEKKYFKDINFKSAFYFIIWGLFQKIIIADNLARFVNDSFANPSNTALLAAIAFCFQIYCDFAGYSNIARGLGLCFGIKLSKNFDIPYLSQTPSEFWRRWHITLSSWVKDYIYIPLGGNRGKLLGASTILITMGLMGLWHGAAWNFVLWGISWGLITMVYRLFHKYFSIFNLRRWMILPRILIFMPLIIITFTLFRSESINHFILMVSKFSLNYFISVQNISILFLIVIIIFYDIIRYIKNDELFITKYNFYILSLFYIFLFVLFVHFYSAENPAFIYFQF